MPNVKPEPVDVSTAPTSNAPRPMQQRQPQPAAIAPQSPMPPTPPSVLTTPMQTPMQTPKKESEPASPASSASRKGKGGRKAANPHLTDEERRRERVLKNRESAMKSLQKKKRYTEDLEHRAIALATRNADLKEKIRGLLNQLQGIGLYALPGIGVFGSLPTNALQSRGGLAADWNLGDLMPMQDTAQNFVAPPGNAHDPPFGDGVGQMSAALGGTRESPEMDVENNVPSATGLPDGVNIQPIGDFALGDAVDSSIGPFDLHHMAISQ